MKALRSSPKKLHFDPCVVELPPSPISLNPSAVSAFDRRATGTQRGHQPDGDGDHARHDAVADSRAQLQRPRSLKIRIQSPSLMSRPLASSG